jgi:F-type H+-transporting ATPase subunit a
MELLVAAILVVLAAIVRSSLSADKPGKLQHIFEGLYGFLRNQAIDVGLEHPDKYMNWLGTIFIAILTMNLIGIIPTFESPTMYVYVPAAFAVMTWLYYHSMSIRELGVSKYLVKFLGPVWWLAWLMLPIEIISDFARMLSLPVRLYGNMLAGEQVTNAFVGLTYLIVPVLFMGLHVFVSFLQAYVFTLLTMIYLSLGTSHEH